MIKASLQHYYRGEYDFNAIRGREKRSVIGGLPSLYRVTIQYKEHRLMTIVHLPVRFLFRGPRRPVSSTTTVLVVGLCRSIDNHRGHWCAGTTGRSDGRHGHNVVDIGRGIATVLVAVRIDQVCGGTGGILAFGWGRYLGHYTVEDGEEKRESRIYH